MTAPCRQMNTRSQLVVKQKNDKGNTTNPLWHVPASLNLFISDVNLWILHSTTFNWWIHCKQQQANSFVLWQCHIFSRHLILPAWPWSQAHFILGDNSGLVPSSVVWHYQLCSGLWYIWGIANVPAAVNERVLCFLVHSKCIIVS